MPDPDNAHDEPPNRPADVPPVTQLGDFRLLREVGRGGMGVVYEAEQVSLGRRVAIKLLPAAVFRDPVKRRRFEREAKAAARLHHTNIVPVHGFGEHGGTPYYVMQFIQGLALDAVIDELGQLPAGGGTAGPRALRTRDEAALSVVLARSLIGEGAAAGGWKPPAGNAPTLTSAGQATPDGPAAAPDPPPRPDRSSSVSISSSGVHLPGQSSSDVASPARKKATYWESVARIGVQVAGALAYAHKLGVLHRDIKPANLLLDVDGIVWVTDFGLAKADDSDSLTQSGDLLGTLRYMPPEAFEGKSDTRSDVYGLGLTLFELVALRPAYEERDRKRLIKQMTTGEPPRLGRLRRDAPRDLVTIVEKAIDREPARRYQSAGAMADDLQRFLDGRPITARRATELERMWMWSRRHPAVACLAAALILCLLAGSALSSVLAIRAADFARDAEAREREATLARDAAHRNAAAAVAARDESARREREAVAARKEAEDQREITQQNLYYAQMHLAQQSWREHRGLPHMQELLANWLPEDESRDRRGWEWFYLNSLPYQNLRTFPKSEGSVKNQTCIVAWHPASKRLAAGTRDGLIRVWDAEREQPTLTLRGPGSASGTHGEARWLAWSPDGGRLAAGFLDGSVHLWETGAGAEAGVLRGHKSAIRAVAYSSDGTRLASWEQNGTIRIWDVDSGRVTAEISHPGDISAGAWSPDDQLLAAGHDDGTVTISGTHADDKIVTLRGHISQIHALAWNPDGTRLASTSFDFTARIWDVASETTVVGPLRHGHEVTSVAWEPNGKRLATGSIDEAVKIWNATTGREQLTLRGHRDMVSSLAWSPDGRLASGSNDGSVRIWDSIRDQESSVLPGHVVRATSVSWSPDGKRLASGGDDGKVRIWDPATREEVLAPLKAHDTGGISQQFGLIRTLAWNPDGKHLASGGLDGTVKVWDIALGREVFALPADHGAVWSVAWSPDGVRLAAGAADGTIRVVEAVKPSPKVQVFKAHEPRRLGSAGEHGVRTLAWSPQGDRLASGGVDGLVKVWDPIRGAELTRMEGHQIWVLSVAWSPDSKRLASGGADRLVIAWDPEAGRPLATMRGHNDFVDGIAWSPDGSQLASAGLDNSVRIWNPRAGEETFVLRGNTGMFHQVSWHPDGTKLAAASSDGQVWIWDATPGFEQDTTPRAHPFIDRKITSKPANNAERLRFAQLAFNHKKFAVATQLWSDALAFDPKLSEDRQTRHRYNAARAACLAAAGLDRDESSLDDASKAKLRRQALDGLKAELTDWGKLLESVRPQDRSTVIEVLSQWEQDRDLTSVRDAERLAQLPVEERKEFARLWADVAELLTKARTPPAGK
ncbi:MAG TPA: protein kinase [Gemmataceae bacterium]|nr:protein kinase [Gemmataceae bacterium]